FAASSGQGATSRPHLTRLADAGSRGFTSRLHLIKLADVGGHGFTSRLHFAKLAGAGGQGFTSRLRFAKLADAGCTAPRLSPAKGCARGSSLMPRRSAPSAREPKRCSPTNGSLTNEGGGGQGGRAQRNKGGGPAQPVRRTFAEPFPPG